MSDVVCRSCRMICHETTHRFNPEVKCHGAMFKVKERFRSYGPFKEVDTTQPGHLECPNCGTLYVDGGGVFCCELKGDGVAPHKSKGIDSSKNATILHMLKNGSTNTEIGNAIGASRQAVTQRLKELKQATS